MSFAVSTGSVSAESSSASAAVGLDRAASAVARNKMRVSGAPGVMRSVNGELLAMAAERVESAGEAGPIGDVRRVGAPREINGGVDAL